MAGFAAELLDTYNAAPVASHMARSGPSTGPGGFSAMRRTIRAAAAAGLLALGALSLSACSMISSVAPGLAPSPSPTAIAGHNPSDVTIMTKQDGKTPSIDVRTGNALSVAGLTVMDQILLAHPETQHGSFSQTQQNWDSTMGPALRPLLNDDMFKQTEQNWVAGHQTPVVTNLLGHLDPGQSAAGKTWNDSAGKACTLTEQPFDVSLDKPSVGTSEVGVGGYVFEDVASVVAHCKEGPSIHVKIDYHILFFGNGHPNGFVVSTWDGNTPGGIAIQ